MSDTRAPPNTHLGHDEPGVAWLTITRPKRLNALDVQTIDELREHIERCAHDPEIRCIVLTGQGKTFCAGGDLNVIKETQGDPFAVQRRLRQGIERLVLAIAHAEKPIIAAVNGDAYGAGWNLALSCDMVIASREARFCQAFTKVGLVPDTGGTWSLPRLVGLHRAKELAMMADTITAPEAERLGLVNHVVPHDEVNERVTAYAERLAQGPTTAYGLLKRAMMRAVDSDLQQSLEFEAEAQGLLTTTEDHAEGLAAFFEKRSPRFQGR